MRKDLNKKTTRAFIYSIFVILFAAVNIGYSLYNEMLKYQVKKSDVIPYTDYDFSNLKGKEILSYEDDKYYSMFGIDVSAHQDKIDWQKVKEAGVEFAYIRLGYRGAEKGILKPDEEFERNYEEARKQGIKVGIYWYSQPLQSNEAIEEARHVLRVLNGRHLDLPIVYDLEETYLEDRPSRIAHLDPYQRTICAKDFMKVINNESDYSTMIYTNLYWAENYYNWYMLQGVDIWYAQYSSYPQFNQPIKMWQYSETGHIDGIDGYVDLDIMFIQKSDQN